MTIAAGTSVRAVAGPVLSMMTADRTLGTDHRREHRDSYRLSGKLDAKKLPQALRELLNMPFVEGSASRAYQSRRPSPRVISAGSLSEKQPTATVVQG
jgi:hypothetical protein